MGQHSWLQAVAPGLPDVTGQRFSSDPPYCHGVNRYQRRLPHWDVLGQPLFVTFRLHGSLPAHRMFPPARLTSGEAFVAMDRILDAACSGPVLLARLDIATLIKNALEDGQMRFQRYQLHAFVIMPNHVHLLVTPNMNLRGWLGPLKGFTAHEANRILARRGEPFWQDESYDHVVRSDDEFRRIGRYIENNPVKAGLAQTVSSFKWSSAYEGMPERQPAAIRGCSRPFQDGLAHRPLHHGRGRGRFIGRACSPKRTANHQNGQSGEHTQSD